MRTRNARAVVAVAVSGLLAAAGCIAPQTYSASTRRARFESTGSRNTPLAVVSTPIAPSEPAAPVATAPPPVAPVAPAPRCIACTTSACRQAFWSRVAECPEPLARTAAAWRPDVVAALGGGMFSTTDPGCHTAQRAYAAYQLATHLGPTTRVLFSGRGPALRPRALTPAEQACATARHEFAIAQGSDPAARRRARARRDAVARTGVAVMTEADFMCGFVLAQLPSDEWQGALRRMLFEAESTSTRENGAFSAPLVVRARLRRVLVVSTMAFPAAGRVDNHARRAFSAFRDARPNPRAYRVAALACPYDRAGRSWALFE